MQPSPTPSLLIRAIQPLSVRRGLAIAALLLLSLNLGACRDPKVTSYRVPKENVAELPASKVVPSPSPTMPASQSMPAMPPSAMPTDPAGPAVPDTHGLQTASGPSLTWSAPAGWQSKPASMMRKATFVIVDDGGATAELAVSAFPGDVGGDVANVNRWRGQVGLAPVSDAEAAAAITRIEANGLKIGVVDLVDPAAANASHLLGAMVPYDNATWFFKLTGPDAVVAKAKPAFMEFLKTVKPASPAAP